MNGFLPPPPNPVKAILCSLSGLPQRHLWSEDPGCARWHCVLQNAWCLPHILALQSHRLRQMHRPMADVAGGPPEKREQRREPSREMCDVLTLPWYFSSHREEFLFVTCRFFLGWLMTFFHSGRNFSVGIWGWGPTALSRRSVLWEAWLFPALLSGLSCPSYSWGFFAEKNCKKGTVSQDVKSVGLFFFLLKKLNLAEVLRRREFDSIEMSIQGRNRISCSQTVTEM